MNNLGDSHRDYFKPNKELQSFTNTQKDFDAPQYYQNPLKYDDADYRKSSKYDRDQFLDNIPNQFDNK